MERFLVAEKAWTILDTSRDARESARNLVALLRNVYRVPVAGFRYRDNRTGRGWVERGDGTDRIPRTDGLTAAEGTPNYPIYDAGKTERGPWILDGPVDPEIGNLLDLLARQWSVLNRPRESTIPVKARGRLIQGGHRCGGCIPGWITVSRVSKRLARRFSELANNPESLLIVGEPGSGKEFLARTLHDMGPRPDEPFRIWPQPIVADDGTLFVPDAITPGEPGYEALQGAAVSNGPPRVIAAGTDGENPPFRREVDWKLEVRLPSLWERREDIPLIAEIILGGIAKHKGESIPGLSGTALEALMNYRWPGNFPELEAALIRAVDYSVGGCIGLGDLPAMVRGSLLKPTTPSYPEKLIALEYEILREELTRQRGNMTGTARALGLTPRQISWRTKRYGLDHRDFKTPRKC